MRLRTLCLQGITLASLEHACGRLDRYFFKEFVAGKRPEKIEAHQDYEIQISSESVEEVSAILKDLSECGTSYHYGQLRWEELNARWTVARTAQGIS